MVPAQTFQLITEMAEDDVRAWACPVKRGTVTTARAAVAISFLVIMAGH
ncbi:hypothetical protein GCM10023075_21470 [Streptosporangium album]